MVPATKTVGLVFTKKKIESSGFIGLAEHASTRNIRIVIIDLSLPLEEQGHLDLIVHKMTDIVAKMDRGDVEAKKQYTHFMDYVHGHPNVLILDEWKNIVKVLDRMELYHHTLACSIKDEKPLFFVPKSILLESATNWDHLDIQFPVICKRRTACSSKEAHEMMLIPNKDGMSKVADFSMNQPVILQEFIQHDGVIVKIYVADSHITVSTRPSFKNIDSTGDVVHFDSQMLPKTFGTTHPLDDNLEKAILKMDSNMIHVDKEAILDLNILKSMTASLQERLGLTFFGFDVLLESKTNQYYVVDVNYFPGYKNVENFHSIFVDIVEKELSKSQ